MRAASTQDPSEVPRRAKFGDVAVALRSVAPPGAAGPATRIPVQPGTIRRDMGPRRTLFRSVRPCASPADRPAPGRHEDGAGRPSAAGGTGGATRR